MKHITITGAAGFIGSSLAEYLYTKGYSLLLIDNLKHGYIENLENHLLPFFKELDCNTQADQIAQLIPEKSVIIHLAGISSLPECEINPLYAYENNVMAVVKMLEIALKRKSEKLIFASTSAVYENNSEYPFVESLINTPDLIYSQTKYLSEQICKSYSKNNKLSILIPRFFNVYGAKQDRKRKNPPFTAYLMNCFENNIAPTIYNWSEIKRDYIYYKDLNEILLRMIEGNRMYQAELYNCCSNYAYSPKDIFSIMKNSFNSNLDPIISEPQMIWSKYRFEDRNFSVERIIKEATKKSIGNNLKVVKEFGYKPLFHFEDGINEVISKKECNESHKTA
jgi:nucleoside-diphosphate-sugar epimerase